MGLFKLSLGLPPMVEFPQRVSEVVVKICLVRRQLDGRMQQRRCFGIMLSLDQDNRSAKERLGRVPENLFDRLRTRTLTPRRLRKRGPLRRKCNPQKGNANSPLKLTPPGCHRKKSV